MNLNPDATKEVTLETTSQERATRKEIFELIIGDLRNYQSGMLDNAAKLTASWLVALGWLVTSTETREFLGKNVSAKVAFCIVLFVGAIITAGMYNKVYRMSQSAFAQLEALGYLNVECYRDRVIDRQTRNACIIGTILLAATAGLIVLLAK